MKCRCGHGRVFHKTSANATRKRRRLGLRPTGNLPCVYVFYGLGINGPDSGRCRCRNWHPAEVTA